VCLLASLPLLAQGLPDVFSKMDKSAKSFSGMAADIKQTTHTAVVNDDSTQTGTIKLKRVKPTETNFLVDFTAPDAKTVSIAGGEVSIYLPKAKSVQVYDLRAKRAALEQGMLLGFGAQSNDIKWAYEVAFVGQETVNGQSAGHIRLVPKSAEVLQSLKSAELWISDQGLPVQQKFMTSGTGDYTLIQYTNIRVNPSISDKELKLNLPKGVQVQKVGK
jgi:outer membrane lipoprotein-sorting protein